MGQLLVNTLLVFEFLLNLLVRIKCFGRYRGMDVRKPISTYHVFLTCILDLSKTSISPCLLWSPNRLLPWSFACQRETSRSSSSRRVFVGIDDLDQLPLDTSGGDSGQAARGTLLTPFPAGFLLRISSTHFGQSHSSPFLSHPHTEASLFRTVGSGCSIFLLQPVLSQSMKQYLLVVVTNAITFLL
jgi:hypothetical protein